MTKPCERPKKKFTLTVVPESDGDRLIAHKTHGRTTRQGICRFVSLLLEVNEKLSQRNKMSDATIRKLVLREFSHLLEKKRSSIKRLSEKKITIGYYRSQYNAGYFSRGKRPPSQSRRYDNNGIIVLHGNTKETQEYNRELRERDPLLN